MNEGVKLLIDRMESNPEDFEDRDFEPNTGRITRGKFKGVADMLKKRLSGEKPAWDAMNVLTTEEIEALTAAYLQMERKRFTNSIMTKLLAEKLEDEGGPMTAGFIAQTISPAMTFGSNGNLGISTTSGFNGTALVANTGVQTKNAVTIAPYANGPTIDFNAQNINTLNEMIAKWRGEDDGAI